MFFNILRVKYIVLISAQYNYCICSYEDEYLIFVMCFKYENKIRHINRMTVGYFCINSITILFTFFDFQQLSQSEKEKHGPNDIQENV